jgi:ATP-binding cassette subfamily B protein
MPPIFFISRRYSRLAHPNFVQVQQKQAELTTVSEESILGARVVRAFGQEHRETERARKLNDEIVERELYARKLEAKYAPFYSFIPNIALAVVVLIAANRINAGSMTLGEFFAFYGYMLQLTGPVRIVGNLLTRAQRATAAGERLFELLDDDETLPLVAHPRTSFPHESGPLTVKFDNVSFAYRNGKTVLSELNLDIAAGETIALLGPTGSGKTTAAELIPRLYDATDGTVLVDGVDVREMDLPTLRRTVGVVGQEPFLFSATVRDNLTLGAPDAPDEELWKALESAQAAAFIRALPDGLDTLIGERGFTLSGGQRQRMAIARALAANPRILILDDATASVDARVERRITTALGDATEGRTTILIAHRPSTIALADRIVLLDAGRIVDVGTHDELLARSERYQMVQEQKASRREFLIDPDPAEDDAGVPEDLDA